MPGLKGPLTEDVLFSPSMTVWLIGFAVLLGSFAILWSVPEGKWKTIWKVLRAEPGDRDVKKANAVRIEPEDSSDGNPRELSSERFPDWNRPLMKYPFNSLGPVSEAPRAYEEDKQAASRFFTTLPSEIRLQIYELAFGQRLMTMNWIKILDGETSTEIPLHPQGTWPYNLHWQVKFSRLGTQMHNMSSPHRIIRDFAHHKMHRDRSRESSFSHFPAWLSNCQIASV